MGDGEVDVEVWLRAAATESRGFLVTASAEPGDLRAEGSFDPGAVTAEEVAAAVDAMESGNLGAEATEAFGRSLFAALFVGDVATLYESARRLGRVRLRLIIDLEPAQRIPWELLHDGERFLALAGPVARGISSLVPAEPSTATLPLRILVVDAFPEGVEKLDGQLEASEIESALRPLVKEGKAEVDTLRGATLDDLRDRLRTAAAEPDSRPFHVFHFIGHGLLDEEELDPNKQSTYLLFERPETRAPHRVGPDDLLDVIGDYDLKLVFLNSCKSVGTNAQGAAKTFAPELLDHGIPALIGMQTTIVDSVAKTFSREFYRAVADNSSVDQALTDARRSAKTSDTEYVSDIGVPVCYLRSASGRILDLQPAPAPARFTRSWFLEKLADNVMSAIVGLVIVALIGVFLGFLRGPEKMNEFEFNVAVAEFATLDGAAGSTARDLGIELAEILEAALGEIDDTEVWGPDRTGRIDGATAEERAENAEDLADSINADVVVYGVLRGAGLSGEFIPEFFVNDRQFSAASELTGPYPLGDGDAFDSNMGGLDDLEPQLAGRANGLARLVGGLLAYTNGSYDRALERLQQATAVEGWSDGDGKEVAWLFLGSTHARLRDYAAAAAALERAIEIEPGYARVLIGRADITFQQARGTCFPPADPAGLVLAAQQFREALAVPDPPPLADIEEKAAYGLGRVYMCERIGSIGSNAAAPQFDQVIAAYEEGDAAKQRRLKELAAESHANLGILFATVEPVDLTRSIDEYGAGIDLTADDERKAVFLSNQAEAYARSGRCPEAVAGLERAAQLTDDASYRDRLASQQAELSC